MPTATAIMESSVKLSALHPRYEAGQKDTMLPVIVQRVLSLALAARDARNRPNIDAEESDRLDLSWMSSSRSCRSSRLAGWKGMGVVVQAYGPRAAFVIDWLYALAERLDRRIMVSPRQGRLLGHRDQSALKCWGSTATRVHA